MRVLGSWHGALYVRLSFFFLTFFFFPSLSEIRNTTQLQSPNTTPLPPPQKKIKRVKKVNKSLKSDVFKFKKKKKNRFMAASKVLSEECVNGGGGGGK